VRAWLVVVLLLAPARALAEPAGDPARDDFCDDAIVDPAAVGLRAGNFDAVRGACLRSELDLRLDTRALIDPDDFHGMLGGDLQIGVRTLEDFGLEWGLSLQIADYTFAQTAVVTASQATYGPFSLHGALGRRLRDDLQVTAYLRTEVPFTRSLLDVSMAGSQAAALASWDAHRRVVLHGRIAALFWYASSQAGDDVRGAALVSTDASIRAIRWLDAIAGLELQAGWYGAGVDHLAARAGAHWRVRGAWRVEVAAVVPFAGAERTNAALTIAVRQDR